mmetsp:Transcript_25500/g.55722  ORF Transcript_25500/g.55722 Transcript_25500/m.55722 type:complete len:271 (-) Transcript_25500:21-833(-)
MLTLSTDETAAFVIAGVPGSNKYRLRLIDPKQNYSTHNLRCEKDWRSMGCRLKYLMTFNAFGMVAPLFITVTCNASELPPEMSPDGVLLGTVPEGEIAKLEGVYIYYDVINRIFRRVGKSEGATEKATLGGRHEAHLKNAAKKALNGGLYSKYASVNAERVCKESLKGGGRFETHLKQYCMFGFDRSAMTAAQKAALLPDKPDSSMFVWSKATMEYINGYCARNKLVREDVQFTMLNYSLEHSGKLLLARAFNLSGTHGWEKFMVPQLAE